MAINDWLRLRLRLWLWLWLWLLLWLFLWLWALLEAESRELERLEERKSSRHIIISLLYSGLFQHENMFLCNTVLADR